MRRLLLSLSAALALAGLTASLAAAGGMAIVVPDESTGIDDPVAGEPFSLGFTLLQHGVTPVDDGLVEVVLASPGGQELVSRAEAQGDGHWLVETTLPESGAWSWTVRMPNGLEIVQPSGTPMITVGAAPEPLDVPLLAGGLGLAFVALLGALMLAARSANGARRTAQRGMVRQP
jgi:hypothetical protein